MQRERCGRPHAARQGQSRRVVVHERVVEPFVRVVVGQGKIQHTARRSKQRARSSLGRGRHWPRSHKLVGRGLNGRCLLCLSCCASGHGDTARQRDKQARKAQGLGRRKARRGGCHHRVGCGVYAMSACPCTPKLTSLRVESAIAPQSVFVFCAPHQSLLCHAHARHPAAARADTCTSSLCDGVALDQPKLTMHRCHASPLHCTKYNCGCRCCLHFGRVVLWLATSRRNDT